MRQRDKKNKHSTYKGQAYRCLQNTLKSIYYLFLRSYYLLYKNMNLKIAYNYLQYLMKGYLV